MGAACGKGGKIRDLLTAAKSELQLERYEKAKELCDEALKYEKDNGTAHYLKGLALHYMGKYKKAISSFEKTIEQFPAWRNALLNKAIALYSIQKHKDAIKCCDSAIKVDSSYALAYYQKGLSLQALGKLDDAIESYDRALDLDPDLESAEIAREEAEDELEELEDEDDQLTNIDDRASRGTLKLKLYFSSFVLTI